MAASPIITYPVVCEDSTGSISEEILQDVFSKFGQIHSIKVVPLGKNATKKRAYINYVNQEDAVIAVANLKTALYIGSNQIEVKLGKITAPFDYRPLTDCKYKDQCDTADGMPCPYRHLSKLTTNVCEKWLHKKCRDKSCSDQHPSFDDPDSVQSTSTLKLQLNKESSASKAPISNLTTPTSGLEELYQCSVCLEIFENPYTLPCQHSLCKECLDGLVQVNVSVTIKCPLCNAAHVVDKGITSFKASLIMKQTLEYMKASRPDGKVQQTCQVTEGCQRAVSTYCINSKSYLCEQCKQDCLLPDLITYQPMKYSNNQDNLAAFCHLHESFETHCCTMCHELCCIYCTQTNHKDHDIILVNDYNENNFKIDREDDKLEELEGVKSYLESIQNVSENYISEMKSKTDEIKNAIRLNKMKIISQCIFMANKLEEQLLSTLDSHQAKQSNILQTSINDHSLDIALLSSVLEEADKYKKKNQMERFYHYLEIKDTIDNIYQEQIFDNNYVPPSEPKIEISDDPLEECDSLFNVMKNKFEFIKVSSDVLDSTKYCLLEIPNAPFHKTKAYNKMIKSEESVKKYINTNLQGFSTENTEKKSNEKKKKKKTTEKNDDKQNIENLLLSNSESVNEVNDEEDTLNSVPIPQDISDSDNEAEDDTLSINSNDSESVTSEGGDVAGRGKKRVRNRRGNNRGGPHVRGAPHVRGGPHTRGGPHIRGNPNMRGGPHMRGNPHMRSNPNMRGGPHMRGCQRARGGHGLLNNPQSQENVQAHHQHNCHLMFQPPPPLMQQNAPPTNYRNLSSASSVPNLSAYTTQDKINTRLYCHKCKVQGHLTKQCIKNK